MRIHKDEEIKFEAKASTVLTVPFLMFTISDSYQSQAARAWLYIHIRYGAMILAHNICLFKHMPRLGCKKRNQ